MGWPMPLASLMATILRRCDDFISRITRRDSSTYTLTVLGVEGFLPGYGVYEGGVVASEMAEFVRHPGSRSFELSRSNCGLARICAG